MTALSWSSRVRHDSDVTFREWGLELSTKLAAAGLVQTADTGQINWATVTRAGSNTDAGYEVWRMADTPQATAPVYFRIAYGTLGGTTAPSIKVTVGTGTDGAGTLTGTALTTARQIHQTGVQVVDTLRNSYLCVNEGFFGLNWKQGAGGTEALFVFNRTCDATGTATVTGALCVWGFGQGSLLTATQALRFAATAAAYTARTTNLNTALGFNPQIPSATLVGADPQVFMGWTITPQVAPLFGVCGVLDAEFLTGNTFTVALVGATPRTYVALTNAAGPFGPSATSEAGMPKFAMLYD